MKPCRGPENELEATKSSLSTAELVASSDGGGPSGGGMLVAGAARIQAPLIQPRIAVWQGSSTVMAPEKRGEVGATTQGSVAMRKVQLSDSTENPFARPNVVLYFGPAHE